MITELSKLTKEERNGIAEFIYSYQTDILIKQDAIRIVYILAVHKLLTHPQGWVWDINNKRDSIADTLYDILVSKISKDFVEDIMKEYYGQ